MMISKINELLKGPIYKCNKVERDECLFNILCDVFRHHLEHCMPYKKMCEKRGIDISSFKSLADMPYLPTSIFKDTLLLSIPKESVFREIQSSATTSGRPSRIGLDKENNRRWTISLQRMLLDRIGNRRCAMMVMDDESALGRSGVISARASMTRSLLFCASDVKTCVLSEGGTLSLDRDALEGFLSGAGDGDGILLFGFTFILYAYVVRPLLESGVRFDLPEAKIVHAGGWKKLQTQHVSPEKLTEDCCQCFGVRPENIIDLYGFTEQGGMLYPTCEQGVRHTPSWGEVICRDPLTLNPLPPGKEGLMQFITPIQTSYPGHSILTEDVGCITGYDDCPCGRKGTTFRIIGRSQTATEERGCGDIMSEMFA